jgi:hypothetical protein
MSQARQDCEALLEAAKPYAERLLQQQGEFYPFGYAMRSDGQMVAVAADDERDRPPSSDLIQLLKDAFRQGARSNTYKATALVFDVRVRLPSNGEVSDAIALALDHRDNGYSVVVLHPYELRDGTLTLHEAYAEPGEAEIFPSG